MAKAHVYLAPGANVETTDTFAGWIDTTNQLVYDMGTVVLTSVPLAQPNTTVGGYTTGNSHLQGILSANTLVASQSLRGGTVSTFADLTVSSNVIFNTSELIRVDANTNNFTINANNTNFTSNVAINNPAKTVTITAGNTSINAGTFYVKSNTEFTGTRVDVDGTAFDITSNTIFTSSTLNANVDVITLGFNGSDTLNVNSVSDFNANVNIDGIFTVTANATFSGAQVSFANNVIIGVDTVDMLTINAQLASDITPLNTTIDLGSDAKPFGNVHTTFVYADNDVESIGTFTLKGTTAKTLRVTGSDNAYKDFNLTFSNNSVSNTSLVANTSGVYGGANDLYSLGSSTVRWKDINARDAAIANSAVITGDLAVNGGDITTSSNTFNLLDTTATTVNAFSAATAIVIGANTGTLTLDNPTIVSSNASINVFNTVATTVNAFGAATNLTIGAATGTATIRNPAIVGPASLNLFNTVTTSLNLASAATTLNIGNAAAAQTINIGNASTGVSTYNIATGATASANTKTVNIGTSGATGSITNVIVGSNTGGTTTLSSGTVVGASPTVNLWNTGSTTVNAFGAATSIVFGAATGLTNIKNNLEVDGDVTIDGGDIITPSATFNVFNTPTTVNAYNAATALTIGSTTGTATIRNATVALSGSALTTPSPTYSLIDTAATTVNAFGAATTLNIGAANTITTLGKNTGNTTLIVSSGGLAGMATIDSNATTGIFRVAPTISTGEVRVGSVNAGKLKVVFNTDSSSSITGAVIVDGGVGIAKQLFVGGATRISGNTTIQGNLVVDGAVTFTNSSNVNIVVSESSINDLFVANTLTMDTATVSSEFVPTANTTYDLGSVTNNWRTIYVRDVNSANVVANNISAKSVNVIDGVKDSIIISPSINGTLGRRITIKPPAAAIAANRSLTLADGDTILQAGTMAVTSGNLAQFATTTSAQLAGIISDETGTGVLVYNISPSLTTPSIGAGGANFSGSTSGTSNLKASAIAGTTTITLPATTGTLALTTDIGDGTLSITANNGLSGAGTFDANQVGNSSVTLTNTDRGSAQNIFKNIVVGANTIIANTNSDTFSIAGSGTVSVSANPTTKVITIAGGAADTLATITARGANTGVSVQFTNTDAATTTETGAVRITGGLGVQGGIQVGAASKFYSDLVVTGNLTIEGTTTTLNTTDLVVEDKNIILGNVGTPSDTSADGGGITLRGLTNKTIIWDDVNDNWTASEHLNIPTGKSYKINNVALLNATSLGSTVVGSSLTSVGTITSGTWNGTTITANSGGTGQSSYTVGDILFATGTTALGKLADIATGNSLISGGVGVAPSWGKIGLTTHITGTLAIGNGGTGQTTAIAAYNALSPITTLGDTVYQGGTNATRLPGNITTTRQYLAQTGTGTISAAPVWTALGKADVGLPNVEDIAISTYTGTATTDTVGTITTGTWSANTIAVSKGGTGQTSYTDGQILIGDNTTGSLVKAVITPGQNIAVTNGAGSITIAAANTNLSSTNGTTAGPTITSSTGANVIIPSANGTNSGIVTTGAQTFAGVKTFNSVIDGDINGNANTVTNGVYTAGNQTIAGIKTFSSVIDGDINGNANTVTNGVYTAGNQTIAGVKTFSSQITGSISGNANTVTNGVYTAGNQTIAGAKTFTSVITVPDSNNTTGAFTGINLSGASSTYIFGTTGDAASSTQANLKIASWNGIGFAPTIADQATPQWQNAIWMDVRNGSIACRGNVSAYASDVRLKTNFKTIESPIEKLSKIGGYEFDWDMEKCLSLGFKPNNIHEHGLKAQEIQTVVPDAVSIAPFDDGGDKTSRSGENYLTVNYERIVPLLIEAIKELKAEIEELKKGK